MNTMSEFRVRAVTSFITLTSEDFLSGTKNKNPTTKSPLEKKLSKYATFLKQTEEKLTKAGYEIQTLRIATNPFGEYLAPASDIDTLKEQLSELDETLKSVEIEFFALGPATNPEEVDCCPHIVSTSHRLSCSADLNPKDMFMMGKKSAECMKTISQLDSAPHVKNGLGNFQFCASAACKAYTPYFPAARSTSIFDSKNSLDDAIHFSLGLENGKLAKRLLSETKTFDNISTTFRNGMAEALEPLTNLCKSIAANGDGNIQFEGIDTSLNPSLDSGGSVASAIEEIDIVDEFGGRGTIAVAAEITKALKSLPGIKNAGYSGLMLPICEDHRLAELEISTTSLLGISSVCGVGLDTVPVSGFASVEGLTALILDVGSLSMKYNKSLSCRLLLCPGKKAGELTEFQSPYLCNSNILDVQ